jgi:segregation and condensation protein B
VEGQRARGEDHVADHQDGAAIEAIGDLPGLDELKGTGLLDGRLPAGFQVPLPSDDAALREDEDPLEPGDLDLTLAPRPTPEE